MKVKINNYTFNKAAKTVTFTDYTTIALDSILLITNVTDNIIIYNFADPLKGGTVSNNVLSLVYDTSSMSNTDKLLIYYDEEIDGKILHSATVTTTGASTSIDSTGYGSIVFQLSGIWNGNLYFEVSNDGVYWDIVYVLSRDEVSLQDVVDQNGTYSVKRSGRYVRYNVTDLDGSMEVHAVGRVGEGLSAADMVSFAMDRTQRLPLQVQLPVDLKQDQSGALVLADMQGPIYWNSPGVASPITIDCTGYSTVIVQKITTGIVTPTVSNDGSNFVGTLAVTVTSATGMAATIPTAAGVYVIPVVAKWLKLTGPASSVQCYIYLSQAPFNQDSMIINPPVNLAQIGGTNTVTGGVNGSLGVAGNLAAGSSGTTIQPLLIGGTDDIKGVSAATTNYLRRALFDSNGRLQIGTNTGQAAGTAAATTLNNLGWLSTYKNILEVQDTSKTDGISRDELLYSLLIEMRIMNQYLYELPGLMVSGRPSQDPPEAFRNDPTIFN